MTWHRLFALVALGLLGCTSFPDIPDTGCGNGVIDGFEDCDSFPLAKGQVCREKGLVGECHLDCSLNDGLRPSCPLGWGCGADSICRKPNGDYEDPAPSVDIGAWSLASGDFDGDGRDDVMSSEPLDSIGATRVKFLYFDAQGVLAEQRPFPKLMIAPTVSRFPGDSLDDVTFTEGPIGVMLGHRDRVWVPETFTAYRIDQVEARAIGVSDRSVDSSAPFLSLLSYSLESGSPAASGFFVVDPQTGQLSEHAHINGEISDLVGSLVSANVLEDKAESPCFEPAYALRGATHFTILNTCQADLERGQVKWRDPFDAIDIALDPPAPIDAAPLFVDIDGDGHLDVLVGARGRPYVAYGDGRALTTAVPYRVALANDQQISPDIAMPLAAGDVTSDGAPDFVFPDHLLLSYQSGQARPAYYDQVRNHLAAPVSIARIADFNGNGTLDIVTASQGSINLQVYNGTGGPNVTETVLPTSAAVEDLAVGDFDGDLVKDLALLEAPRVGDPRATVKVAYGSAFGKLGDPTAVAQLAGAAQLTTFGADGMASLVVTSSIAVDGVQSGGLTILNGTSDRVPFAPFSLSEFIANGSVREALGVSCAVGDFTGKSRGDILALAFFAPEPKSDEVPAPDFWIVPAVLEGSESPRQLKVPFDSRLSPVRFFDQNSDFAVDVSSASANLWGDARQEGIFAMPAGAARDQCAFYTLGVADATETFAGKVRPTFAADLREPVVIDEPCLDPSVVPVDVDGDGDVDLALLTGEAGAPDRKLFVFWNGGSGSFSSSERSLISNLADSPQAFSVLPAVGDQPPKFVYVTSDRLQLVSRDLKTGEFSPPNTIFGALHGGTGVTVADVNGDRVGDIVVAESGTLRVLKARLKVP